MDATTETYISLIHRKGKELFGNAYDMEQSDERVRRWIAHGLTASGIWKTIRWWFDFQHKPVSEANNGFGIVPHVYNEARRYWADIYRLKRDYYTETSVSAAVSPKKEDVIVQMPKRHEVKPLKGFDLL